MRVDQLGGIESSVVGKVLDVCSVRVELGTADKRGCD